jgi:hypothetical protein
MDEIERIKSVWESEASFIRQSGSGASEDDRQSFLRSWGQMLEAAELAKTEINQIVNAFAKKWAL